MWSDEQLKDAIQVLLNSSDQKCVKKVEDSVRDGTKETYVVVGDVTYTDKLYVEALERLVKDGRFKKTEDHQGECVYRKA